MKTLGDGKLYFHNLGGARDVFDPRTTSKRCATARSPHRACTLGTA